MLFHFLLEVLSGAALLAIAAWVVCAVAGCVLLGVGLILISRPFQRFLEEITLFAEVAQQLHRRLRVWI